MIRIFAQQNVQQSAKTSTTLTLVFRDLTRTSSYEVFTKEHLSLAPQERPAAACELAKVG